MRFFAETKAGKHRMKFHVFVYVVAAAALWRLWYSPQQSLWWIVFVGLLLSLWSNRAVTAGVKVALRDLGYSDVSDVANPVEKAMHSPDGAAIRFWMHAAVVLNVATLLLAVVGFFFA